MSRKIRQLVADLEQAGFRFEPGKGSHRKYRHHSGVWVVISGQAGDDAKHYQEKQTREAIEKAKSREKN
ncbi:MAG TPA: type II toxin-antitoxin system HicA family toxin [Opitutaceae bacterium]|nr:type II toxin-antitoxin system HicA family toxin [Opitutaceae bacterium]